MANNIPFQAQGKTYKANVTTGSQTVTITADSPCNQLLVSNHQPTGTGGQPVYFVVSSNASITATVPTNGSPQYCLVSVPGTIKSFTVPSQFGSANVYIAFIGEAASECYFTPGEGY
jgi:hypothetical protein